MSKPLACKKLLNAVNSCVDENLQGLVAVNSGLRLIAENRVVIRGDIDEVKKQKRVTLLSGGGSGHEPAHAGYVGPGMLSAAVAGSVFASPPPHHIVGALRAIGKDNPAGCLVIVKNYTGDRINFGLAVEKVKAEGIKVDLLVVGEDCALKSADKTAGRRGLCGTVFIHKICGALAEQGRSLEEIIAIADNATKQMGTIGLSLSSCGVPGAGHSFKLDEDEVELGLGIHGEAGVKRTKLVTAKETVKTMIDHMTNPENSTHLEIRKGDTVAVMINNLGGLSVLEMNIIAHEAIQYFESKGVVVDRAYSGSFMTSLEMAGVSISVLQLDEVLKQCLDAPTDAPGWQKPFIGRGVQNRFTPDAIHTVDAKDVAEKKIEPSYNEAVYNILSNVCDALIKAESRLNSLDTQCGDGDCGSTIYRGVTAIRKQLGSKDEPGLPLNDPSSLAFSLSSLVEDSMGGASGGLYSLFLTAASHAFKDTVSAGSWFNALNSGMEAVIRFGGAEPGDRTMIDALFAANSVLKQYDGTGPANKVFLEAVKAAEEAAQATAGMKAHAGRASYVNPENLTQPDPGAVAVSIWLRAIANSLPS